MTTQFQPPSEPTTTPPIPYNQWAPALAQLGIKEENRNNDYQRIYTIHRGTDFDRHIEENRYSSMIHVKREGVNLPGLKIPKSEKETYYITDIAKRLEPNGELSLEGQFFRDGSMYGTTAEVTLWNQAGKHFDEFTTLHAAAQEICHRLEIEFHGRTATANIKETHNLSKIVNTLTRLQTYHNRIYLLFKTEGQRLADLAEILEQDPYHKE